MEEGSCPHTPTVMRFLCALTTINITHPSDPIPHIFPDTPIPLHTPIQTHHFPHNFPGTPTRLPINLLTSCVPAGNCAIAMCNCTILLRKACMRDEHQTRHTHPPTQAHPPPPTYPDTPTPAHLPRHTHPCPPTQTHPSPPTYPDTPTPAHLPRHTHTSTHHVVHAQVTRYRVHILVSVHLVSCGGGGWGLEL